MLHISLKIIIFMHYNNYSNLVNNRAKKI